MKNKNFEIAVWIGITVILAGLGFMGGYYVPRWWDNWKRKNLYIVRYCQHERAEIRDRSGVLLVGNRPRHTPNDRVRYAAVDGKFAAALLGFTEFAHGREVGRSGVEKMIDRESVPGNPVYVSIDCGIQKILESWMERLEKAGVERCNYQYAVCLNSQGEVLGSAQRPVVDLNNRHQVTGGTHLFPSTYVVNIPEKIMNLLGSSSSASIEEKAKFQFHHKSGVLSPEARGWVRGLNIPADSARSPQSATAFNLLLAYIGVNERKPIPQLQIFSSGKQPVVTLAKSIEWAAVTSEEMQITAVGKAPAVDGSFVYVLICLEVKNGNDAQKIISEIKSL